MSKSFRRRRNLIDPRLQLKVGALFVISLGTVLVLFGALMYQGVMGLFEDSIIDMADLSNHIMSITMSRLLIAVGLGATLTMALAIVVTHRAAGPIYRMEKFLTAIQNGENPEAVHLRKDDAFQDFCALLNEVTKPLRSGDPATESEHEADDDAPATESKRERETSTTS